MKEFDPKSPFCGIGLEEFRLRFDEILDLPQIIAKDKGLKIVVCIDEFQTIKEIR